MNHRTVVPCFNYDCFYIGLKICLIGSPTPLTLSTFFILRHRHSYIVVIGLPNRQDTVFLLKTQFN